MTGEERRKQIVDILTLSDKPLSGDALATKLGVSRQIIVGDIALLRTSGLAIFSTNRGYLIEKPDANYSCRVFKVKHTDEESADEMRLIVDLGGHLLDVFVYHRVYGIIRGDLNIKSRLDVTRYMSSIESGKSTYLKNITSDYHYHTVMAESEEILDIIEGELKSNGFLAELSDYEPAELMKNQ